MTKRFLITIGIMGGLSVLFGIIGSQILCENISPQDMISFNMASFYMMFHALALLGIAFMNRYVSRSYLNPIYYLFVSGTVLFSGTVYIKSLKELTGFAPEAINNIATFGGLLLFAGWIILIFSGISYKHKKRHH